MLVGFLGDIYLAKIRYNIVMESFLEKIEESIQRSPNDRKKIREIQKELEEAFGNRIYSKKFDYDLNLEDLNKLFAIFNRYLFSNKLDRNEIDIAISEHNKKEKGSFFLGMDKNNKHLLQIVKYSKDNFFQIVNVFLHELIHFYDCSYGPLKNERETAKVAIMNNRQYVGNYDVHGKYFKDWCDRINKFGFCVKEKYSIDDKRVMKKITEKNRKTDKFFDSKSKEDDEQYKIVKTFYNALKNCEKSMVYRDAKHWYIQID